MASIANLAVSLSANTAAFTEGMNKAANKTREFSKTFDKELTRTAISVGALKLAAVSINKALDQAVRTSEEFAQGTISGADAVEQLGRAAARGVPIVGEFFAAGEKLATVYTNMSASLREFNVAIAEQERKLARVAGSERVYVKSIEEARQGVQALVRQNELLNANSADRGMISARHAFEDATAKAADLRAELDKIAKTPLFAGKRAELEEQIAGIESSAAAVLDTQRRLAREAKTAPVSKMIEDLVRQVEEFGVPAFDKMRKQVLDTFGPESAAFVDRYKARLDELTAQAEQRKAAEDAAADAARAAQQEQARLMEEGRAVYESVLTELEKHEGELDRLSKLLDKGAIDWNTYAKAVKKVNIEFNKLSKLELPGAKTIQFGSIAGNPSLSGGASSVTSKIEKNTKDSLDVQKKQLDAMKMLVTQTKNGVGITVVGLGDF